MDLDLIFQWIGILNVASFVLIGIGDFIIASMTIIVKKTPSEKDDKKLEAAQVWLDAIKEIYEEFRKLVDRFSTFSRPRK